MVLKEIEKAGNCEGRLQNTELTVSYRTED